MNGEELRSAYVEGMDNDRQPFGEPLDLSQIALEVRGRPVGVDRRLIGIELVEHDPTRRCRLLPEIISQVAGFGPAWRQHSTQQRLERISLARLGAEHSNDLHMGGQLAVLSQRVRRHAHTPRSAGQPERVKHACARRHSPRPCQIIAQSEACGSEPAPRSI